MSGTDEKLGFTNWPQYDVWPEPKVTVAGRRAIGISNGKAFGLIRALPQRLSQARIPRHLRKSKHLFIHVPKNAGVSIAEALYGRQAWHWTALDICNADPVFFSSRVSFAIVRNPWDRLVSAYEFLRDGGTPRARPARETMPPAWTLATFETFVLEFILPNQDRLKALDEVLWPQHIFVNDSDGKCIVDFIGRYEDLDRFEALIRRERVIPGPLAHLNRSSNRAARDYRSYFKSAELIDSVGRCYATDVSQFSYRF